MDFYSELEKKLIFDYLISVSEKAILNNEVPIAACFVAKNLSQNENFEDLVMKIIETESSRLFLFESTHNWTNKTGNATKHCEVLGIQNISKFNHRNSTKQSPFFLKFEDLDCFVTVEPCIMCGSALKISKTRKVYYIAPNSKFGGICSVLKLEGVQNEQFDYKKGEIINLLKSFYEKGNQRLKPELRHRRAHREISPKLLGKRPEIEKERKLKDSMKIDDN